jgi:ribose transport system ATP-binding protein
MIYSQFCDAIVNNTPVLKSEIYTVVTVCKDISFSVLPGEVVGITGLGGSGRTEMAKLILKTDKRKSGTLILNGKVIKTDSPFDAVKHEIGFVSKTERKKECFTTFDQT